MTTTPNILPCPWCGAEALLYPVPDCGWVRCQRTACSASGPTRGTNQEAISAWNRVAGLRAEIARAVAEEREACIAAIRARGAKEATQ